MRKFIKEERGLAVVEATLLLPFCMIMVIAVFYAAIFMCQKANLQANLQNSLIYYKNVSSDTFVQAAGQISYTGDTGTAASGSSYSVDGKKFPYRFLGMSFESSSMESFFRSMCGHMFFDTGENVDFTADSVNYVVYKEITATATQTVKPAINLSMVGASNEMTISVTGKAIVNDADELIRNVDFVVDIVSETKLGQQISSLAQKVSDAYEKFTEKFTKG